MIIFYYGVAAALIFIGFFLTATTEWAKQHTYLLALSVGIGAGLIVYGVLTQREERSKPEKSGEGESAEKRD